MVQQNLSAHEHPLRKVFSSDFELGIPPYQRPYRWGKEQALQLLEDLAQTLDRNDDEPYFLGSLVLVEGKGARHEVIDGQQRLTTLTILFAVLRDLASSSNIAEELGSLVMEPGSVLDDIDPQPRLTPRYQEREFLGEYVQTAGGTHGLSGMTDAVAKTEPQRRIRDNANALTKELTTWDETRRTKLASLMRNRTYLVVVSTVDLSSAYRIFSVMNARGLDLAPGDIFKSLVVGQLPTGSPLTREWEDAEENLLRLRTEGFTELLLDLRTVHSGVRARRELLVEFPEQVLNAYIESGRANDFVKELLLPYADAFYRISSADAGPAPTWGPVNKWLRRFGHIDATDWRPAALWAFVNHGDDPDFLEAFLRQLERLAAQFLIRGTYSSQRLERYLRLLAELKNGDGLDAAAFTLTDTEKSGTLDSLSSELYQMPARRSRYVLLRLDELLANTPGVTYAHPIISIEHVLPQNPRADSDWFRNFSEDERSQWTHRLGNLVLLNRRKNSQARNFDFNEKKARYFHVDGTSTFALTSQVLGELTWTPSVVASRQLRLVTALAEEWELN